MLLEIITLCVVGSTLFVAKKIGDLMDRGTNLVDNATNLVDRGTNLVDNGTNLVDNGTDLVNDVRTLVIPNMNKQLDRTGETLKAFKRVADNAYALIDQIRHNFNLVTNTVLGIFACGSLSLLLQHTSFLPTSVSLGIWSVLAYLCYSMVAKYRRHSRWLEKPDLDEYQNHVRCCVIIEKT